MKDADASTGPNRSSDTNDWETSGPFGPDDRAEPASRRHRADPLRWSVTTWIALLVTANLAWRVVRFALDFPIWGDEAFVAWSVLSRGPGGFFGPIEYNQIAPAGFMLLEWLAVEIFGPSDASMRLVPWLAGLASMPLMALLALRVLPRHAALGATAIFAASYYPARHAAEIKPYALDLLLAILALLAAAPLLRSAAPGASVTSAAPGSACAPSPGRIAAWSIAAAAVVWLSYPIVFVLGGLLAAGWLRAARRRQWRVAGGLTIVGGVLVASFAAVVLLVAGPQSDTAGEALTGSEHWDFTFPPIAEPARLPRWFLEVHTGNMFAYPNGGNDHGSAATFLLFVLGGIALLRRAPWGVLALLAPFALMFVAAALQKYPYGGSARIAQHVAPAICLLAGMGISVVMRWLGTPARAARGLRLVAIAMLLLIVVGVVRDLRQPWKHRSDLEMERTITELAEAAAPGERWVVFGTLGERVPHAPDVMPWGGSAARLVVHVDRLARGPVAWGPDPSTIEPPASRPLLVMAYRDLEEAFPNGDWRRYVRALERRLGPASARTTIELSQEPEAFEVLKWDPVASGPTSIDG